MLPTPVTLLCIVEIDVVVDIHVYVSDLAGSQGPWTMESEVESVTIQLDFRISQLAHGFNDSIDMRERREDTFLGHKDRETNSNST